MKFSVCFLLLFLSVRLLSQGVIINEVLPSNARHDTLSDGSSPDWIELYNNTSSPINLRGYQLSDKHRLDSNVFIFPDITLAAHSFIPVYATGISDQRPSVKHWETLVRMGDTCRYTIPNKAIDNWTALSFDASGWNKGKTGIGFGDGDDSTLVDVGTITVYLRQSFIIEDVTKIIDMYLHVDFDDGFVAYLNGSPIAASGLELNPLFDAFSSSDHEAQMVSGGSPLAIHIDKLVSLLHNGLNVLSVEVHNVSSSSSDLSIIPFLTIGCTEKPKIARGVSSQLSLTTKEENTLQARFQLNADDDAVFLYSPAKQQIDSMFFKSMPVNVSQGRLYGITSVDHWFSTPTLAAENAKIAFDARALDEPKASVPAGIYTKPFKVGIRSKDQGVVFYYTTDGSEPSPSNGTLYVDSIEINSSRNLRVCATYPNCIASKTLTNTYLITDHKITLPILSISVKPDDFFDEQSGIYVLGPNAAAEEPYYGANYWLDIEKPVHLEFFETNGVRAFSVNAGAKISGNWTRVFPQKSLKFYMRKQYGDEILSYRIFKDKPIDDFERLILRNAGNDFNIAQMRDGLTSALVRNMNVDRQAYRPTAVFINGEYWGVQELRERLDDSYVQSNFGLNTDSLDLLESDATIKEGSNVDYLNMRDFVSNNSMADDANFAKLEQLIDFDNYIDYINTELYVVNLDWPGNNIRYWRTPGRKWRWMLYDTDFGFAEWDTTKVRAHTLNLAIVDDGRPWPRPEWSTRLLKGLVQNTSFKHRLSNAMADRLNTTFSYDSVARLIDSLQALIHNEMFYHKQRWGGEYETWIDDIALLDSFARKRPRYVREDFVQFFSYTGTYQLQLTSSDNKAGSIKLNTITLNKFPWRGQYFNDVPISLIAVPRPGYRFVRWEGDTASTMHQLSLNPNATFSVKAIFEYLPGSEPQIVINEVMYNNTSSNNASDWLEVYNKGDKSADMSAWTISDEKPYNSYTFPQGTIVPAKSYLVICKDSSAFSLKYPAKSIKHIGNLGFDFAEDHDVISLYDSTHNLIDRLAYSDSRPWYAKADGVGYSLERQSIGSRPENWKAISYGGTPGASNNAAVSSGQYPIVISEINYNDAPSRKSGDWFELYNNGSQPIDMGEWLIEDLGGNHYLIPKNTIIEPQKALVFAKELNLFSAIYPSVNNVVECDISLGSDVEALKIFDRNEQLVDSVQFSSSNPWPTAANGQGFTLVCNDLNKDNSQYTNWRTGQAFGSPGILDTVHQQTIDQTNKDICVSVFPNPATNFVHVIAPIGTILSIVDVIGSQIIWQSSSTQPDSLIDVSSYPSGVYYLRIQQDSVNIIKVLVKQ